MEPGDLDPSGQAQSSGLGLLKVQTQVCIKHRRLHLQRQAIGQIGQEGRQIQRHHLERRFSLAGRRERRDFGICVKFAAIEIKRQPWVHLDFTVRIQIAQEWQRQLHGAQAVLALHLGGAISQVQRALIQHQVVQGKLRARRSWCIRRWTHPLHHIVHVVTPTPEVREMQHRASELCVGDHRRHSQQGLQLCVDVNARHGKLRCAAILSGHRKVGDGELQRPGFEINRTHRDAAPQGLTAVLFDLVLEQRWHDQPAQGPACQQAQQCPSGATRPG